MSSVSPECSDEEDYFLDFDAEITDEECSQQSKTLHHLLVLDIELLQAHLNGDIIKQRLLHDLNEIDLYIPLSTSFLEISLANAWGLVHGLPIILHLTFNSSIYLAGSESNMKSAVDVYQSDTLLRNNIINQLKKILEEFVERQFKNLSNEILQHSYLSPSKSGAVAAGPCSCTPSCKENVANEELSLCTHFDDAKNIPGLEKGFLVQIHRYMTKRLLTICDYCPVCDEPHSLSMNSILKPTVCSKPLCIFASQTLGVMADVSSALNQEREVVQLLVSLTRLAVNSSRCDLVLMPYPSVFNSLLEKELILHVTHKDNKLLEHLMDVFPPMDALTASSESKLREQLNAVNVSCYPLLRWIISSNRCHIAKLDESKQFDFIWTSGQFLLLNSPPAKEANFRALKKSYGSVYAFHGSPLENWHSIIREGLIVASGTDKQLHGAAYGKGIYLSPNLHLAMSYCGPTKAKGNRHTRMITSCVALCEVINGPSLKYKSDSILVCQESKYVCTRFFFVFYSQDSKAQKCATSTMRYSAKELTKKVKEVLSS